MNQLRGGAMTLAIRHTHTLSREKSGGENSTLPLNRSEKVVEGDKGEKGMEGVVGGSRVSLDLYQTFEW